MPFLTIAGVSYEVVEDGADEQEPVRIGSVHRSFGGAPRSSVRAEKRVRVFTLIEVTYAQAETLRNNTNMGKVVTINGDAVGNVSYSAIVYINGSTYVRVSGGGFIFDVSVRVEAA